MEARDRCKAIARHLEYEIWMLQQGASALAKPGLDTVTRNAFINSCAVHSRNLVDFFYPTDRAYKCTNCGYESPLKRKDDSRAEDFFEHPDRWRELAGSMPEEFAKVRSMTAKQVVHLTVQRAELDPIEKAWDFPSIFRAASRLLRLLIDHAPGDRLPPEMNQRLANYYGHIPDAPQPTMTSAPIVIQSAEFGGPIKGLD